jgi:hypothetical protein
MLKVKRLENQIMFGASKLKGINRMAKIIYGHLCLREEYLCFNNNNNYIKYIKWELNEI